LRDYKQENCSASAAGPSPPCKDSKKPHVTDSEAAIFVIPKAGPHCAPDTQDSEAARFH